MPSSDWKDVSARLAALFPFRFALVKVANERFYEISFLKSMSTVTVDTCRAGHLRLFLALYLMKTFYFTIFYQKQVVLVLLAQNKAVLRAGHLQFLLKKIFSTKNTASAQLWARQWTESPLTFRRKCNGHSRCSDHRELAVHENKKQIWPFLKFGRLRNI